MGIGVFEKVVQKIKDIVVEKAVAERDKILIRNIPSYSQFWKHLIWRNVGTTITAVDIKQKYFSTNDILFWQKKKKKSLSWKLSNFNKKKKNPYDIGN